MKIRAKTGVFNWNEGEYLSVGYDADNLFVYLIKGDIKHNAENQLIRKTEDVKMAHELSLSIYIAKENEIPVFDVEAWIDEYKRVKEQERGDNTNENPCN